MMKWNWTCFSFFYEHRLPLVLKEEEEEEWVWDIDSPIGIKPIKVEIENQNQKNKNKMIISKMREIRKGRISWNSHIEHENTKKFNLETQKFAVALKTKTNSDSFLRHKIDHRSSWVIDILTGTKWFQRPIHFTKFSVKPDVERREFR